MKNKLLVILLSLVMSFASVSAVWANTDEKTVRTDENVNNVLIEEQVCTNTDDIEENDSKSNNRYYYYNKTTSATKYKYFTDAQARNLTIVKNGLIATVGIAGWWAPPLGGISLAAGWIWGGKAPSKSKITVKTVKRYRVNRLTGQKICVDIWKYYTIKSWAKDSAGTYYVLGTSYGSRKLK